MRNPQKVTTVRTEAVADGLGVYDWQSGKTHVMNATTALVWEHCDGQTAPDQIATLLQSRFDLTRQHAEGVLRLALQELSKAELLADAPSLPEGPSRRDLFKTLATAGLSLILIPVVTAVAASAATDDPGHHHRADEGDDGDGDDDHHHHHHHHHHHTTTPGPATTGLPGTTTSRGTTSTRPVRSHHGRH